MQGMDQILQTMSTSWGVMVGYLRFACLTVFNEIRKADLDILRKYEKIDMIPFILFQFLSLIIIHRIWIHRKFCARCMQFMFFIFVYGLMFLVFFHTPIGGDANVKNVEDDVIYTADLYKQMEQCENPYWMEDLLRGEKARIGAENTSTEFIILEKISSMISFKNSEDLLYIGIIIIMYLGILLSVMYFLNKIRNKENRKTTCHRRRYKVVKQNGQNSSE